MSWPSKCRKPPTWPRVVTRKVPVQVARVVDEEVVRKIPVQVCRMVQEEQVRRVPVTTYQTGRRARAAANARAGLQNGRGRSRAAHSGDHLSHGDRRTCRADPVQVCKIVAMQQTVRIPRVVEKRIPVVYTQQVPRTVVMRVPLKPVAILLRRFDGGGRVRRPGCYAGAGRSTYVPAPAPSSRPRGQPTPAPLAQTPRRRHGESEHRAPTSALDFAPEEKVSPGRWTKRRTGRLVARASEPKTLYLSASEWAGRPSQCFPLNNQRQGHGPMWVSAPFYALAGRGPTPWPVV